MFKLKLTSCKICKANTTSKGFTQHITKQHKMTLKDYLMIYEFEGKEPDCKCGCGNTVTIRGYNVMDYVDGHCPTGHFKNGASPNRDNEKWLKNVTKGIQDYNLKAKKENPSYRSAENNTFYNKRHSEATKNVLRNHTENQIARGKHSFIGNLNGRLGKSSLEQKFESRLVDLKIPYIHNYKISYRPQDALADRYKYYDFYLPKFNKLVELHGTYWHPKKLNENLSELQIKNYHNDIFKQQLAMNRGYELDVVYDTELDTYIDKLIAEIPNP
jgi:hypothetical protein